MTIETIVKQGIKELQRVINKIATALDDAPARAPVYEPDEPAPWRSKHKPGSMDWWRELQARPEQRDQGVTMNALRRSVPRPRLPRSAAEARGEVRGRWLRIDEEADWPTTVIAPSCDAWRERRVPPQPKPPALTQRPSWLPRSWFK